RVLIIATFREEEMDRGGALAETLGDLATAPGVRRLTLGPLSREATSKLAQGSSTDVEELYRMTGGNAFGIAVATAIFAARGRLTTTSGFVAGMRPALAAAAALSLCGAMAALAMGGRRSSPTASHKRVEEPAAAVVSG